MGPHNRLYDTRSKPVVVDNCCKRFTILLYCPDDALSKCVCYDLGV